MHLTERERVRFYEEAIVDVTESSRNGVHRGITFGEKSKCCDAEITFKNIKRHTSEKIIIAEIACMKCSSFLGDTTVSERKIRR
tara:strand:+ start:36 stop:287 length:252 start_codon:yes stop_codon:yes gene_type:complete